ncbi:unnamed protein product [Toxocara canis]|uniref:Saposin B-type domain-containing protein n=1 Tax=Toxocara canis TaxID=6265 RepID=A0A183UUZ9_TOXCA|nr:unnamed protein product [Toxocara canis]
MRLSLMVLCSMLATRCATMPTDNVLPTMQCELCEKFVTNIQQSLNERKDNIEQEASILCDNLTASNNLLDPICKQIIDVELDGIIKGLNNATEPTQICKNILLCI